MLYTTYAAIFAIFVFAILFASKLGSRSREYPPGPPTLPIIGNLHQIPTKNAHIQFTTWARQYGPIYRIFLGSQPVIVLTGGDVVKELLDKRSAVYSDRSDINIMDQFPVGRLRLFLMRYGPLWRDLRKLVHSLLGHRASTAYTPYQMLERKQMLYEILEAPNDNFTIFQRYSTSLATTLIFGWRTPENDSPRSKRLFQEIDALQAVLTTGVAALLDAFPILRHMPDYLLPIKAKARTALEFGTEVHMDNWTEAKKGMSEKTIRACLSVGLAKAQAKGDMSDLVAAYTAGNVFEGAGKSISDSLYAFVQAMLLFPDVQAKAQAEIEEIVGPNRMLTAADAADLPYTRRCMKELTRWFTTAPLGAAPHAAIRDDEYMGYKIPKGAPVVLNVWGIHTDPVRFPEPRRYNPDRFSEESMKLSLAEAAVHSDLSKRDTFGFGAGRRICPGIHVAESSLFLAISGILWAFYCCPKKDAAGEDMLPDPEDLIVTVAAYPAPYQADIQVRSAERAKIIREEWTQAQELLDPANKQWKETPAGVWSAALEV